MALDRSPDFFSFHLSHISPAPPGGINFRPINLAWRNLIECHLRNISTKLFENWPDTFGGEDFLSFHFSHIRQNSPAPPGGHVFWPINMDWRNLIEGHQRNISTNYFKICQTVWEKKNFEVFFISLPWKPEFCMDPKNLKEFWWGHWEDALCRVSSQLTHWLLRRRSWRMTHNGQKAITITHLEQSSGDLTRGPWWPCIAHLNYTMYCNAKHIKTIILNATSTVNKIFLHLA